MAPVRHDVQNGNMLGNIHGHMSQDREDVLRTYRLCVLGKGQRDSSVLSARLGETACNSRFTFLLRRQFFFCEYRRLHDIT